MEILWISAAIPAFLDQQILRLEAPQCLIADPVILDFILQLLELSFVCLVLQGRIQAVVQLSALIAGLVYFQVQDHQRALHVLQDILSMPLSGVVDRVPQGNLPMCPH
jgi:hypothetical protein